MAFLLQLATHQCGVVHIENEFGVGLIARGGISSWRLGTGNGAFELEVTLTEYTRQSIIARFLHFLSACAKKAN